MFTLKVIFEVIVIVALIYGYIKEEQIANWEKETLIPYIKKLIKGDDNNDRQIHS